MNNEILEIIRILYENTQRISVRELAGIMGISPSKTKRLIQEAADLLPSDIGSIQSKAGNHQGYMLEIYDPDRFETLLADLRRPENNINERELRISRLIFSFLSDRIVKMEDLADECHVSRSQLTNDLKIVRSRLAEYDLKIESIPYKGMQISGAESSKRLCTLSEIQRNYSDGFRHFTAAVVFDQKVADDIVDMLNRELSASHYHASENGFNNIVLYLLISIRRIKEGHMVEDGSDTFHDIYDDKYLYDLADRILLNAGDIAHVQFSRNELLYLTVQLSANRSLPSDGSVFVPSQISDLVNEILEKIKQTYMRDYTNDFDLRINLGLYIVPMLTRLKYRINITNPLLREIKKKYMNEFDYALCGVSVIRKYYEYPIPESEVAYIALYFVLADPGFHTVPQGKDILLVCQTTNISSILLKQKLESDFPSYIANVDLCSVEDMKAYDLSCYDCVFTTLPLTDDIPVPVINVRHFLTDSEWKRIESVICKNQIDFDSYFDPDLFLTNVPGNTAEEIITAMVTHIKKYRDLPDEFLDDILLRESLSATDLGYKTAIPHANGNDNFVCIGILPRPIQWDTIKVSVVALICTSKNETDSDLSFHEALLKFIDDPNAVETLLRRPEFDTLRKIFTDLEV